MMLGRDQRDVFKIQDTTMQTEKVKIHKMYLVNL